MRCCDGFEMFAGVSRFELSVTQPLLPDSIALLGRQFFQVAKVLPRKFTLFRSELAPFLKSGLHAFLLEGRELRKTFCHAEQLAFLKFREMVPFLGKRGKNGALLRAELIPLRRPTGLGGKRQ